MLGLMVVSHGNLAREFLEVSFKIMGEEDPAVLPVCIDWAADSVAAKEQIKKALKKLQDSSDGVLLLTDLFGGTPTNLAMTFYQAGKVEILTGVNLPMLIKALSIRKSGTALKEAVKTLREKGQSAMVSVSEVLNSEEGEGA